MLRIATAFLLLAACGAGVHEDATSIEPSLQLVVSTSLPIRRSIGLQVAVQGSVRDIRLFVNGTRVTALAPPSYEYVWDSSDMPEGTYTLYALATIPSGLTVASNEVQVIVDRTAPEVSSYHPATGDQRRTTAADFSVTFSEPLLRASLTLAAATLLCNGLEVGGWIALSDDAMTLMVTPGEVPPLPFQCVLHLSGLLTDRAGNPLHLPANDPSWNWPQPSAPGPMAAVRHAGGTNSLLVSWDLPVDDGGSPLTAVRVRYLAPTAEVFDVDPVSPGFEATNLANGVTLSLSVSAVNAVGEGPATGLPDFTPSWTGTTRLYQSATTLASGRVLITGGLVAIGTTFPLPGTLYDPATGQVAAADTGERLRWGSSAALLADGRVLVAGGMTVAGAELVVTTAAQIYDPASNSFTDIGSLVNGAFMATATLLGNGTVLLAGNNEAMKNWTYWGSGVAAAPQIYDPADGTFAAVGGGRIPQPGASVARLPSGKALLIGPTDGNTTPAGSAVLFDPATRAFTEIGPTQAFHTYATITLLNDGRALIAGGGSTAAEIYDPLEGTFTRAAELLAPRKGHTATLLADGRVLLVGGTSDGGNPVEIYDPATGGVAATDVLYPRSWHTATRLATGKLFVLGGLYALGPGTCPEELYTLP
jgi:hypothetical protein